MDEPVDAEVQELRDLLQEAVQETGPILLEPEVVAVERRVELPSGPMHRSKVAAEPFRIHLREDVGRSTSSRERHREPPEESANGEIGDAVGESVIHIGR